MGLCYHNIHFTAHSALAGRLIGHVGVGKWGGGVRHALCRIAVLFSLQFIESRTERGDQLHQLSNHFGDAEAV